MSPWNASGGGLCIRIARGKTDPAGQGAEIGLPRGKHADTCPVRAFQAWQAVAKRKALAERKRNPGLGQMIDSHPADLG